MVQPTTENVSTVNVPYAVGCLAAYAWSFEDICREYTLKETIILREQPAAVVSRMENPYLVGFSNYLWNFEYNKALAECIKAAYPDCIIVFGGPQISADGALLQKHAFIDILQHYEGEVSFCEMLRALATGEDLSTVNNLSFRSQGGIVTTAFSAPAQLDFPSPYQTGFMDEIMRNYSQLQFEPLIETNRGCPHKCAYCSWGGVKGKVRQFSLERVFADLEWCAAHKMEFLGVADANFGMFERDELIVDKIIELKKTTGYPKKFQVSYVPYSKASWARLFRITKKLSDNDLCKGVTLSFQSMSPTVQTNIGRNNINAENYKFQMKEYVAADIPTYSEFILGLPGETQESFQQGMEEILELGQHTSLFVHLCEWLPMSQMANPTYMQQYQVAYSKIPLNQPHAKKSEDAITEYSRIVTSTYSMSEEDWVQMNLFSVCVLCFHHLRLLQFAALYLYHEKQMKYTDFYTSLLHYLLENNTIFQQIKLLFENVIKKHEGAVMFDDAFGNIAWGPEEYAFLKLITQKEQFFEQIKGFLQPLFEDEQILDEILAYQSFCLKEVGKVCRCRSFHYDWKTYFDSLLANEPAVLKKEDVTYALKADETYADMADYAKKVMWYGRKGGKNIYTQEIQKIKPVGEGKRNIYFVQPNDIYKGKVPSTYIPYASGCIIAYLKRNKIIDEHFDFKKIIYTRVPIEQLVAGLEEPYAVLFSCSVWNTEYDKKAAQAVKAAYPDCQVVFGGHNISSDGTFLEQYEYIDFLTHRFGEETNEGLFEYFLGLKALEDIDNISYRSGKEIITTRYVPQSGIEYPSPYLDGIFDELLEDDVNFSAVFETNRGCPNQCSFCDWGELKAKVRLFPLERVKAEIDWFAAHKIEFIYAADANFGMFSRDVEIAKYVVESKKRCGYPQVFRVNFTKKKLDVVFQIGAMFFEYDLDKAQTISFQSMDEKVLANVGRKNISVESFKRLMKQYNDIDIATHSELILGLPGETYDSFCEGIGNLLENGQHYSFIVYPCMLLPNSEMGQPWYIKKFGIKTARIPFQMVHTVERADENEILEYGSYTTQTNSMSLEDWVLSLIYSKYTQALHSLGLLKNVSLFYRNEYQVSFADFYKLFINFSQREDMPLLHRVYLKVYELCHKIARSESGFMATCEGLGNILWELDEVIYLEFFKCLEQFYAETKQCLEEHFGKSPTVDAVFQYQFDVIKKIAVDEVKITSDYDFYTYFNNILLYNYEPLQKVPLCFTVKDEAPVKDLSEYARQVIWYGRNKRLTDYSSSFYRPSTVFHQPQ